MILIFHDVNVRGHLMVIFLKINSPKTRLKKSITNPSLVDFSAFCSIPSAVRVADSMTYICWLTSIGISIVEIVALWLLYVHNGISYTGKTIYSYWIDLNTKSHNTPVPYPTVHRSEQKCEHFCPEWYIVGYGTGALQDLWDWSIKATFPSQHSEQSIILIPHMLKYVEVF